MKGTVKAAKVILNPQISVNKLAEYLTADSSRRKRILQDAKFPEEFITARYKDARVTAKKYISGQVDKVFVQKEIAKFKQQEKDAAKISGNEYKINDSKSSALALEQLLLLPVKELRGVDVSDYNEPNKKIIKNGLTISITPDLITKKTNGDTTNVGCIKLSIIKKYLSDESQKFVGVLLYEYVRKYIAKADRGEVVNSKLCISLDIFKQQLEVCPASMTVRQKKIEDACEEIAARWSSISKD